MKKTRFLSAVVALSLLLGAILTGCAATPTASAAASDAAATSAAAEATVSAAASAAAASGDTIKIGAIMPMTGDVSVYGTSTSNAIKIAIDEINKAGGINGRQLELKLEDDQNTPDVSINAFNKLVSQDKVDVIIGSVASKCTLAIAPLAQQAGIPLITTASTNEQVTEAGDYVFRTCFIDPFQGTVNAKFALENLKLTTAAILYDNGNDYSKGLATNFKAAFTAGGGTITNEEAYSLADQDFSAIIAKVKDKNPQILFIPDYYGKDALIAKQVRDAGLKDIVLLGGDGWDGIVTPDADLSPSGAYFSNHYDSGADDPDVKAFVEKYKAAYNDTPNALAALGYDAMMIVANAMKTAGSTDKAAVRDAIAKTDGKFVTGNIKYDDKRNPVKSAVIISVYTDDSGKLAQKYYATINP